MAQKRSKPAPLATGTGLGVSQSWSACNPEILATPSEIQKNHLIARFGLAAERARLTASLAFGEARHG